MFRHSLLYRCAVMTKTKLESRAEIVTESCRQVLQERQALRQQLYDLTRERLRTSATAMLVGTVKERLLSPDHSAIHLSVETICDITQDGGRPGVDVVLHSVQCYGDVLVKYVTQDVRVGSTVFVQGALKNPAGVGPTVDVHHPVGSLYVI